jgi:hypothetical protein
MTMRMLLLTPFFFALPANARAQAGELPFEDFRISGSVLLGTGHNAQAGLTLSANVNASFYFPLIENFGLRAGMTFLSQPDLDLTDGGGGATLFSLGGAADYTIGMGEVWGLGLAAGVEGAPWGKLDASGYSSPGETIRGVVFVQEAALRRAIRVGIWEFGIRGDEFVGSGTTITNVGVFFRFSFRL